MRGRLPRGRRGVAERHGYPIAHVDHDYERIAALTGQATRWVAIP